MLRTEDYSQRDVLAERMTTTLETMQATHRNMVKTLEEIRKANQQQNANFKKWEHAMTAHTAEIRRLKTAVTNGINSMSLRFEEGADDIDNERDVLAIEEPDDVLFEPPGTEDELRALNERCKKATFVNTMLHRVSSYCKQDSFHGQQNTSGYHLIDHIIQRKLFLEATWFGTFNKFAFNKYEAVIQFIRKAIHHIDSTWTGTQNELFLQNCMHNSKSRFESRNLRKISGRPNRRKRKLTTEEESKPRRKRKTPTVTA